MNVIQIFKPCMGQEECDAVAKVLKSGWIGLGPKTAEFEREFAKYVGTKYAIATNSCTAALHLALKSFHIGQGDEVLASSLTFVSTIHAIVYNSATPVFVDIDSDTLCISIKDIEKKITPRTKAIIPMHYGGHSCDMDEILEISEKHNLIVIEDAAQACGAKYKGRKIGSIADATCFSFHAVKNLSTGEGGMITTNRLEIMDKIKRLRWLGIDKSTWQRTESGEREIKTGISQYASYGWYYEVYDLGYKYHMSDIAAAIGLVQLKKLDKMNTRRGEIIDNYNRTFKDIDWIETPVERDYVRSAHHNYVIKTPYRDELNLYLKEKGIASGVHYMPIHLHPYYKDRFAAKVPLAEHIWTKLLTLPLYPDLTEGDLAYVIDSVKDFERK